MHHATGFDPNYSLYETNGEILQQSSGGLTSSFPDIHISADQLRMVSCTETAQSAFLEQESTIAQKLYLAWQGQGLVGVLTTLTSEEEQVPSGIRTIADYMSIGLKWLRGMHFNLFPHLKLSHEQLIATYSSNLQWKESCVRCLSWHPRAEKFALALKNDVIHIHYLDNVLVPVLKHKLQHNVSCMVWKPLSASLLAVATNSAVLLWNIDPSSLSTRPSMGAVQVLTYGGHAPVTSLQWSPHGDDFLLAASALSSAIIAWSTTLKEYQVLHHVTSGVSSLYWSPDGSKVLATTPTKSFRVFETQLWSNEQWGNLQQRIKCACWNPDGTILLFSMLGDTKVLSLSFPDNRHGDECSIDGAQSASLAIDFTNQEEELCDSNEVTAMAWDSTGTWLAIGLGDNVINLFNASTNPVLTITARGCIKSHGDSTIVFMCFKPRFKNGACLTVCWSDGKLSYIPLIGDTRCHQISPRTIPQNNFVSQNENTLFSLLE